MELTISRKVYIGSGDRGVRLMKAIQELANRHCHGNVSKFLIYTACQKYRINPQTGEALKPGEKPARC